MKILLGIFVYKALCAAVIPALITIHDVRLCLHLPKYSYRVVKGTSEPISKLLPIYLIKSAEQINYVNVN